MGELYNGVCPTVKWERFIGWFLDHVFLSCAFYIHSCFPILIICFSISQLETAPVNAPMLGSLVVNAILVVIYKVSLFFSLFYSFFKLAFSEMDIVVFKVLVVVLM